MSNLGIINKKRLLYQRANMISSAEERGFNKAMTEVAQSLLDVFDNKTMAVKQGDVGGY